MGSVCCFAAAAAAAAAAADGDDYDDDDDDDDFFNQPVLPGFLHFMPVPCRRISLGCCCRFLSLRRR